MRRLRWAIALFVLGGLHLFAAGSMRAQTPTTGQITGVVKDLSGGVVSEAKLTLTSDAGVQRETASDAAGHYAFPLLPPGVYRLEAEKSGFSKAIAENIVVRITETTSLDLRLQLATQSASIEVKAVSPLVDTENAARGSVIDQDQIRQLPLPTRNFQQLLTLTPGTSGPVQNSSELGRGAAPIYVDGLRSTSNSVIINGIDANSIGTGSLPNLAVPATDTLQEFIVQTSQYDASQGRVAGGVVAAVTKSGTNEFHGNLYEFLRNDELNANNFFLNRSDIARPPYKRNQFGGTLGGPLQKDRLWFFISYQGTRETNGTSLTNSIGTAFVPADLSNDRSEATLDNLAKSFGVAACTPVTAGCLQAFNPMADFLLKATLPSGQLVIPSAASPVANPGTPAPTVPVPVVGISKYEEDQFNTNLDYKVSSANRLSVKFFWADNPETQALFDLYGITNALPVPGFGAQVNFNDRVVSVNDTHVISPALLNDFHFGYSSISSSSNPQEPFTAAQLGITSPLGSLFPGMPEISVFNDFDLGANPFSDNGGIEKTYTVGDTLSWQKGRHNLKFGAEYKHHDIGFTFNLYTRGQIFFLGSSGNPFGDFLGAFAPAGVPATSLTVIGSGVNNIDNRAQDWAGFVNDEWRLTDRFTVTLGLRYDFFGPFTEAQGHYIGFDPERVQTVPFLVPGTVAVTGGFVQAANAKDPLPGVPEIRSSLVPPDKNNFAPRVGFAWQPFSTTNRFVIRGGYGIYYDRANARLLNNQLLNFPYFTLAQTEATPIATPFVQVRQPSAFPLTFNNHAIFPFGGPPAFLPQAVTPIAPTGMAVIPANGIYPDIHDFRTPYIQQYSLGVQYEFANSWLLDVSYVGSEGRKELRLVDLNQEIGTTPPGLPGPLSYGLSSLPLEGFGVHAMQSSANSNYNSMQVGVTKRFSYGLQFLAAYTYSHSLDDYSGDPTGTSDVTVVPGNQAPGFLNNYASSDFDRRNRLVFSGIYDLPKFYSGESHLARQAVNGWELATIFVVQSGTPFSVLTNATAFVQARADFNPAIPNCNPHISGGVESKLNEYFNVSCFVPATAIGDFGNTGRNIIQGPNQKNVDISIIKFFPVTERFKFEFRTEFFNAFNQVSFQNPGFINSLGNNLASTSVGQITATSTGPRVIQFALKLNF
jgi:Carboxypeptidase regulatory-like domain/TonB dependent receptor/TonB-dependent Receptor Plug Domain